MKTAGGGGRWGRGVMAGLGDLCQVPYTLSHKAVCTLFGSSKRKMAARWYFNIFQLELIDPFFGMTFTLMAKWLATAEPFTEVLEWHFPPFITFFINAVLHSFINHQCKLDTSNHKLLPRDYHNKSNTFYLYWVCVDTRGHLTGSEDSHSTSMK